MSNCTPQLHSVQDVEAGQGAGGGATGESTQHWGGDTATEAALSTAALQTGVRMQRQDARR